MSRVPIATVSMLTVLALAGCGADGSTPERAAAPAPTPSSTHGPDPTPTAEQSPTAEPTRHHSRQQGHKVGTLAPRTRTAADEAHLLAADRLPTVGGRAWTAGGTTDGAVGACQKTPLDTIGATSAVSRTFTADDGLSATQVVAEFADAKSAWRAHQVLVAWRDDCETRVKNSTVGPLEPVTVHTGRADSYRGSFRSRSAGLGILRAGSYLTVVEVTATANGYPSDWDPARVAVRRIARTF